MTAQRHVAYFLQKVNGQPIRFVLGEACPCASLGMATFFPDLITAQAAAFAHCNGDTVVMECHMESKKAGGKHEHLSLL